MLGLDLDLGLGFDLDAQRQGLVVPLLPCMTCDFLLQFLSIHFTACKLPFAKFEDLHSSLVAHFDGFYPRDAMLARVFATATCPSVRPSVCLSVTRRYCD